MSLTFNETKLINLNLSQFPLLGAASASIKKCPVCSHNRANPSMILRAAILRVAQKPEFKQFVRQNFKCPVMLGGHIFQ